MLTLPVNFSADIDVSLRAVESSDAKVLFNLVERNREYLREWLPWLDFNTSLADTEAFIERSIQQHSDGVGLVLLIIHNGQPQGVIGFNWIDALHQSCEIGYWIAEDAQGLGLVTVCTRAMVGYAFTELDLNRVNISAALNNTGSRAIPERLGFSQEGTKREAEWLYDHFADHATYAMLRRDWDIQACLARSQT
jgi:ribosomal-protein-serine acetyltransferase